MKIRYSNNEFPFFDPVAGKFSRIADCLQSGAIHITFLFSKYKEGI